MLTLRDLQRPQRCCQESLCRRVAKRYHERLHLQCGILRQRQRLFRLVRTVQSVQCKRPELHSVLHRQHTRHSVLHLQRRILRQRHQLLAVQAVRRRRVGRRDVRRRLPDRRHGMHLQHGILRRRDDMHTVHAVRP